jgi:catechol 2,3-dioxygenase-like lactoylglutathione lyase family enzyme
MSMQCAISQHQEALKRRFLMANTFHVSVYVRSIPEAVDQYRKILGIDPAKVRHDYAKFELTDPPLIFSLNVGGEPGTLSHLGIRYPDTGTVASELVRTKNSGVQTLQQEGTTCCYAKADKFWVRDGDGIPWEMYTLLADADAETAADTQLRAFLAQGDLGDVESMSATPGCCVPQDIPQVAPPQSVQHAANATDSAPTCCGPRTPS